MAVIGWLELAEATKWTGDPTVEPVVGELRVTPANEIAVNPRVIISRRKACFTVPLLQELSVLNFDEDAG